MGIKERQDRERAAVRQAILDAARDLFVTEGYRTVSMRKIAERIEYSPAAIYGYFASKDEIFFALVEEGFRHDQAAPRTLRRATKPIRYEPRARCWSPVTGSRASSPVLRADVRRSVLSAHSRTWNASASSSR